MSLHDQYDMARAPIKPLPYSQRELAQCDEFMIDYEDVDNNPTYHMFIVDHTDETKYIDLTNMIIKEILPNAPISADNFTLTIEGIDEPARLKDLIGFMYKRYVFPENFEGFVYERDIEKIFGTEADTKDVLLRDSNGTINLPITTTANVFDETGVSIKERLDNISRVGFSSEYLQVTSPNQTSFEFVYPYDNYSDFMQVIIGTTIIDKSRYEVTHLVEASGNYSKAILTFIDEGIELGRRIDLIFIYNSSSAGAGTYTTIYGGNIANLSINSAKLEKTTDSFLLNDSTTIATGKAVYNLYNEMTDALNEDPKHALWCVDSSVQNDSIILESPIDILDNDTFYVCVPIQMAKASSLRVSVHNVTTGTTSASYPVTQPNGSVLVRGFPENASVKLLWVKSAQAFWAITNPVSKIKSANYLYIAKDQDTEISYATLPFDADGLLTVYRNGVRLFEPLDYSNDEINRSITLRVRTEEAESIVFEVIYV